MLVLLASPRWHLWPGYYSLVSYSMEILYETNGYLPGHQRHLGEADKTNIWDPSFDEVSTPLNSIFKKVITQLLSLLQVTLQLRMSNF